MSSTNSVPPSDSDLHPSNTPSSESYPEQHHAGAVGYGPNYRQTATFTDKLSGLKEELKGKVTKNPQLVEHGRELKTGELKKKEQEEDMNNLDPFGTADDDQSTSTTDSAPQPVHAHSSAPSATRDAQGQQLPPASPSHDSVSTAPQSGSGSGTAKPRDVKYVDEHHPNNSNSNNTNSNNNTNTNNNAVASEPGQIATDAVHV